MRYDILTCAWKLTVDRLIPLPQDTKIHQTYVVAVLINSFMHSSFNAHKAAQLQTVQHKTQKVLVIIKLDI